MPTATPCRRRRAASYAALAIAVCVSVVLGAGPARAQAAGPPPGPAADVPPAPAAFPDFFDAGRSEDLLARFPNVVLKTHDGRNVRFYDDLLKDKIVLVNFMYASCDER